MPGMDDLIETADVAASFNAGSDARLRGVRLTACNLTDPSAVLHWRRGWLHCNSFWGCDNKGWTIRRLPEIVGAA